MRKNNRGFAIPKEAHYVEAADAQEQLNDVVITFCTTLFSTRGHTGREFSVVKGLTNEQALVYTEM